MSSISNSLAGIIDGLKARNADPAQDPARALRRLNLSGKAHQPYVDIVHFGASDLSVVARTLDEERDDLEQASARVGEAGVALTKIEDLLTQVKDLVTANARGAGRGRRKANQRKIDELLAEVDATATEASEANPDLFSGRATLSAGNVTVQIDPISRESLGKLVLNGRALSLADVVRRGALDTSSGHTAAEGARKSIAQATETVKALREQLETFRSDNVRPRLGDVANALAGLFTDAAGLGSSEAAVETAKQLRDITLASSTAAIAVGADGWDRERVLDLLT